MLPDISIILPFIFAGLMGLSILIYVILDGFDLGIGMLFPFAHNEEKDQMVASIGPFWDANETWLVLATGLLLVAFPMAHGEILGALYLPVFVLLFGLILRGAAFDFRTKVSDNRKKIWNGLFCIGSLIASLAQGYMLGIYVLGIKPGLESFIFGVIVAFCLCACYISVGAAWLIYKTTDDLQKKAVLWLRKSIIITTIGMIIIYITTPLNSARIFDKWFSFPDIFYMLPLPILSLFLFYLLWKKTFLLPKPNDRHALLPFLYLCGIFTLGFLALAWSFYPFVIPDKMTIWESAAGTESLVVIFAGAIVVLPMIIFYSFYSYYVFRGKASTLKYD